MTPIEKDDLCQRAINKWGTRSQAHQAIEECAELITAINKYFFRKDNTIEKFGILEEVADVEIMCQQLRLILGTDEVDAVKEQKWLRFKERIDNDPVRSSI